jgi:hypothetical protein
MGSKRSGFHAEALHPGSYILLALPSATDTSGVIRITSNGVMDSPPRSPGANLVCMGEDGNPFSG